MKMKQIKTTKNTKKQTKAVKPSVVKTKAAYCAKQNKQSDIKQFSSVNEALSEIFSFHMKFTVLKTAAEKVEFFKKFKERLAATAQKHEHFLIKALTKNKWNDSEYLGLLFGIGLYVMKRKILGLDDLFELSNMNIIQVDEIIKVYSERKSKLFDEMYFDPFVSSRGFVISNKITEAINGKKEKSSKDTAKESLKPQKTLNPVLKSVGSICKELSKYVVGQERAKKVLATALFEHILHIRLKEKGYKNSFNKKNVLFLGPTGCGKTYLCQTLAKIAGIPFIMADATQYSATGYVGGDAQDLVTTIAQQTRTPDGGTVPLSIVFIDEFDKLKFNMDSRGFDMTRKVQETLLKILESEKYTCAIKSGFSRGTQTYDISKVLFVASGAFSDLEENVKEENASIGFEVNSSSKAEDVDVVKIAKYGFLPEILGRLTYRVHLEELSKNELYSILTKAENNPISQYEALFKECGKELEIPKNIINQIIDKALLNKTGARGLNTILGEHLQEKLSTMELPEEDINA